MKMEINKQTNKRKKTIFPLANNDYTVFAGRKFKVRHLRSRNSIVPPSNANNALMTFLMLVFTLHTIRNLFGIELGVDTDSIY